MATRRTGKPVKPYARKKAERRVLSPDEEWAARIAAVALDACHPWQRDAVIDPARFFTWLVGRGGGKTTAYAVKYVIGLASITKGRFIYMAQTIGVATDLLWDPLKDLCEAIRSKGIDLQVEFKEVGKILTFPRTGARLKLIGGDDKREMGKQRGQAFDGVGVDEVAEFPPERVEWFVDRIITPRLGERGGWLGLASTPGHALTGIFYDRTRPGAVSDDEAKTPLHVPYADRDKPEYAGLDTWRSHHWRLQDVAELPNAVENYPRIVANWIEALKTFARNKWGPTNPIRKREYDGVWARDNTTNIYQYREHLEGTDAIEAGVPDGAPWNEWDPPRVQRGDLEIAVLPKLGAREVKDWLFVVATDHGAADPFALNVLAASPSDPDRGIYHVLWFDGRKMYPSKIARLMLGPMVEKDLAAAHEKPGGVLGAIGTFPAAMVSDIKHLGEIILLELSQTFGLRFVAAEQAGKFGGFELCNSDLVDGRAHILKGSPLAGELRDLQFIKDEYGVPKEDKSQRNDHADTYLYGTRELHGMFETIGATTPPASQPPSRSGSNQPTEPPPDMTAPVDVPGEYDYLFAGQ